MTVQIDRYRVRLEFARLFADPRLFEAGSNLARTVLLEKGFDNAKSRFIIELDPFTVTDARNNPAKTQGTAKYSFQDKKISSEYMENVTVSTQYLDVGTGTTPEEHYRFWMDGRLWTMPFKLERFNHEPVVLEMPDAPSLYTMVKERARTTTIASIELEGISKDKFDVALAYLESNLQKLAGQDDLRAEVYASRYLDEHEKSALEKRLTKQSTPSTVYLFLGRT